MKHTLHLIAIALVALAIVILPHAWHVFVFEAKPKMILFLSGISFVQFVFAIMWVCYINSEL